MEKPYVVGIDIGATTAKIGLVDMRGNVLAQTAIRSNDTTDAQQFIDNLCDAVRKIVEQNYSLSQIRGIGIGAPNANFYKTYRKHGESHLGRCKNHSVFGDDDGVYRSASAHYQ